jgi:copper transport protein
VILAALLVAGAAGVALAHATLRRADPPAGSHVPHAPSVLRLEFSEAVSPATSRIDLVSPDSQRRALALRAEDRNRKVLVADVPVLTLAGAYRVEWRLIGPDGHAVSGRYVFSVDSIPAAAATPVEAAPARNAVQPALGAFAPDAVSQVLGRLLSTLSITLLIGLTVFALLVLPRASTPQPFAGEFRRRVDLLARKWVLGSLWAVLVIAVGRLLSQGAALGGSLGSIDTSTITGIVTGTSWGRAWLVVVSASLAGLVMLGRGRGTGSPVPWQGLALVCAGLALALPFLGHPAAATAATTAIALDAVHVVAAGGWAGTILAITLVAFPAAYALERDARVGTLRLMLQAFTPVALACASLLVLTGAGEAWIQLGSLAALWTTPYGLSLVRKLVLVVAVAMLGAWHWRIAQPRIESDASVTRLRRSLALDVAIVVGVLTLTAILTGTPPPSDLAHNHRIEAVPN